MQTAALLAATLTAGLMAGVYGIFALAIMPGLRATDDHTFVKAFAAIDRAIVSPLFMLTSRRSRTSATKRPSSRPRRPGSATYRM
jgi:uncharacterized membrane protein